MEKEELGGYLEFASRLVDLQVNIGPAELLRAMDESAVHTFGWPIGIVLHQEEVSPKPYDEGIRALIEKDNHFDFWTLKRNGDFYLLKSLFEDQRRENCIFLDTRSIRTAEVFFRTGQLYKSLGIDENQEIECQIEYGGLNGRTLTVASSNRHLLDRACTGNTVKKIFKGPISGFTELASLQSTVYEVINSITELCEFFSPEKSVIDEMVENYIANGKVK